MSLDCTPKSYPQFLANSLEWESLMVSCLKKRERSAIESLYNTYASAIFGVVFRITGKRSDAEDVLAKVFVKIWNEVDAYNPEEERLFTWILKFARNLAVEKSKKPNFPGLLLSNTNAEGDNYEATRLMHNLDAQERKIMEMLYFKGMSQQEVSTSLSVPLVTVKTCHRQAIVKLRQDLN